MIKKPELSGPSKPVDVPAATSTRMSRQRRRDTEPEMELRRALHRMGLRYRVNMRLPGMPRRRADVTFPKAKLALFVDGCFWHRCPQHATDPVANGSWWAHKLRGNVARDQDTDRRLRQAGWTVLRFWEHEDMSVVAVMIAEFLSDLIARTGRPADTPQAIGSSEEVAPR